MGKDALTREIEQATIQALTPKEVAIPVRDSLPQLLGQLCGHAMNRNGKAVAEVLERIYTAIAELES